MQQKINSVPSAEIKDDSSTNVDVASTVHHHNGNAMLAAVLSPRKLPCLCACCPTCGSVFMATALKEEYHNDFDNMKELLDDITDYARQGYTISSKDASDFRLDYCEHLKAAKV